MPSPQSDLAQQILKDPYTFDLLSLGPDIRERDLELGLIEHLRELIMELGKGFAFVGSQYHLEVGGQDFYLDLLFYHLRLRCFAMNAAAHGFDIVPGKASKVIEEGGAFLTTLRALIANRS